MDSYNTLISPCPQQGIKRLAFNGEFGIRDSSIHTMSRVNNYTNFLLFGKGTPRHNSFLTHGKMAEKGS